MSSEINSIANCRPDAYGTLPSAGSRVRPQICAVPTTHSQQPTAKHARALVTGSVRSPNLLQSVASHDMQEMASRKVADKAKAGPSGLSSGLRETKA